ncbi:hypothetical protein Rt10032_c16g5692 [Rhodotorula toruloides]|uniref:Proteophosphoglycan ppg4 n=1 Tax=Rhodotorula toruloides TaxID=5286 RepID=A0A511KP17_RHOTO|nr:hypothetical protein Rt10032_c16g5692 [Rhodotorula toruloides]
MCYCASRLLVLAASALSRLAGLDYPLLSCDAVEHAFKGFYSSRTPSLPLELLPLILSSFSSFAADAREAHVERTTFYGSCALVHRTWTETARKLRAEEVFMSRTSDPLLRFVRSKPPDVSTLRILVVDSSFPLNSIMAADLCPLYAVCHNLVSLSLIDIRRLELGTLSCLTSLLDLPNLDLLNLSHRTLGDFVNPETIARYLPNGARLPFPIKHLRIEWTDPAMLSHRIDNPLPYDLALISDCATIIQDSRREPLFNGLESITIPPLTASYAAAHFRHYYTGMEILIVQYGEDEIEQQSRREANSAWFRSGFWREVKRRAKE